ncbi:uncharacterized protein LOC129276547 [Lytechinus pictus]|uniref:uncharacterized protein LOC129276547 n=1 Tax=Lytechinus pictus TaxID=7653 RepID=UPI00240D45D6|nr:uncharacterized protein LOC129276547 [Lytechinus pictus]
MSDAMDDTHADEDKPILLDSPSDTTTTPSSDQSREVTYEILMPNENERRHMEQDNEYSVIPELDQSNYTELIHSEVPEPSTYETTTFQPKRGLESSPEHGWNPNWQRTNENDDNDDCSQSALSMADAQSVHSQSASSTADAQSIHSTHSLGSETSPDQMDGGGDHPVGSHITSLIGKLNQTEIVGARPVPTSLPLGTIGSSGPYRGYSRNPGQTLVGSPSQPTASRAEKPKAAFKMRSGEPILGGGGELQYDEDGKEYTEWTENEIYQGRY